MEEERIQYRDVVKLYQDTAYGVSLEERLKRGKLFRTIAQIAEDADHLPIPKIGYWWGNWTWSKDGTLDLYVDNIKTPVYYIILERVKTTNDIMFWVFHMINKQWVTAEIAGNLLLALCDIKREEITEVLV